MVPELIDIRGWQSEDDWRPRSHFDCDRPNPDSWRHHLLEEDDEESKSDYCNELDGYAAPEDVRRFAARHQLAGSLATSIDLAAKHFVGGVRLLRLERDPDNSTDEWIAIRVAVHGSIADALDREDRYSAEFLAFVPSWTERERIRLEYRFCEDDETA